MSDIHPHDLHQLMRTWLLAEDPYGMRGGGPSGRVEPPMGRPGGSDDLARVQGESAVERALAPGARAEPDASGESTRAFGTGAVDQAMDQAMTQQWIDRMRASKAGKKAVGGEMDKAATEGWKAKMQAGKEAKTAPPPSQYPGVPQYLVDQFGPPPPPMTDAEETRWHGEQAVAHELNRDPRAMSAGEDAVRNSLINMNMKPLIDHTLEYQRLQAIRDMIAAHTAANPPPELPENEIPQNMNRLPGTETSFVTTNDFSQMPEFSPGVRGVGIPLARGATIPPPANTNVPGFPVDEQGNALDREGNIIPGGHPVDDLGHPAYPLERSPLFPPPSPPDPNLPPSGRGRLKDPEAPDDRPPE